MHRVNRNVHRVVCTRCSWKLEGQMHRSAYCPCCGQPVKYQHVPEKKD